MAQAYRILDRENRALRETMADLQRARQQLVAAQREAGALVEREKLARDIHDTLAQGLASIVLMSRAAVSSLDSGSASQAREQLSTVVHTAGENLDDARRFVAVLQSGEQQDPGLLDELRRTCRQIEAQAAAQGHGLRCRLRISGGSRPVAGGQAMLVLRTVQASLANVLQHAQAETAAVTLTFLEDDLLADIVDDGVGFDLQQATGAPGAAGAERPTGTGVGLLAVLAYYKDEPLGVTSQISSLTRTGMDEMGWLPNFMPGIDEQLAGCVAVVVDTITTNGWLIAGIVLASFAAALPGRRVRIERATAYSSATAALGGVLLGWGAMIGLGCTIGVLLSGTHAMALSGWVFGAAVVVAAGVGFKLKLHRRAAPGAFGG